MTRTDHYGDTISAEHRQAHIAIRTEADAQAHEASPFHAHPEPVESMRTEVIPHGGGTHPSGQSV